MTTLSVAFDGSMARRFIEVAKEKFEEEGHLEIDEPSGDESNALLQVSATDTLADVRENGGIYVKAWLWVPIELVEGEVPTKDNLKSQ